LNDVDILQALEMRSMDITIPWGHGWGFVNGSEVTQLMLVAQTANWHWINVEQHVSRFTKEFPSVQQTMRLDALWQLMYKP